jgi:hypothetical protein
MILITETATGTCWNLRKTVASPKGREFWLSYHCGAPRSKALPGVVGVYVSSLEEAKAKLGDCTVVES